MYLDRKEPGRTGRHCSISPRSRAQRVRSAAERAYNTPLAATRRQTARRQFERTRTLRSVKSNIDGFRSLATFAIVSSEPRRWLDSSGCVQTPIMISRGRYQGGEMIAHLGVAIVISRQVDGTKKHFGRLIAGAPNSGNVKSLPQEIYRHAFTSA
jgi:hypothetical protein